MRFASRHELPPLSSCIVQICTEWLAVGRQSAPIIILTLRPHLSPFPSSLCLSLPSITLPPCRYFPNRSFPHLPGLSAVVDASSSSVSSRPESAEGCGGRLWPTLADLLTILCKFPVILLHSRHTGSFTFAFAVTLVSLFASLLPSRTHRPGALREVRLRKVIADS
jgi:hypothetical protein